MGAVRVSHGVGGVGQGAMDSAAVTDVASLVGRRVDEVLHEYRAEFI